MFSRSIFSVFAVAVLLVASGCRGNKAENTQKKYPVDFLEAVDWDYQRNGALELTAIDTMAKNEALTRRRFYDADARLTGFKDTAWQISNDPRFAAVDNAAACAALTLDPKSADKIAKWRRYCNTVSNYSYLDYYRRLEKSNSMTRQEQDDYRIFLFELEISQGFYPLEAANGFNFRTIPKADRKSYRSALPEWMAWNSRTPLLWIKLMLMLPQETARTVDLDHSKLAAKVLEISRAVKAAMAFEHIRNFQILLSPAHIRLHAERELELRLAACAMEGVTERTPELSREEDFIRDLYLLMQ